MKPRTLKTLLILALTVLGLLCSLLAYDAKNKVSELKTWIPMKSIVTSTAITREKRSKGTTYCPDIRVAFKLFNTQHTSKLQISQTACSPFKRSAAKTLGTYTVGKAVEVYVNPDRPSEVRLSTYSLGWTFYLSLIVGSLSMMAAVALPFAMTSPTIKRDEKHVG